MRNHIIMSSLGIHRTIQRAWAQLANQGFHVYMPCFFWGGFTVGLLLDLFRNFSRLLEGKSSCLSWCMLVPFGETSSARSEGDKPSLAESIVIFERLLEPLFCALKRPDGSVCRSVCLWFVGFHGGCQYVYIFVGASQATPNLCIVFILFVEFQELFVGLFVC